MTDRERLIKLYKEATTQYLDYLESIDQKGLIDTEGRAKFTVDYLLANGVIVPVRCKECEHFTPKEKLNPIKYINPLEADGFCENLDKYIDADDFCSYGKLKELNDNAING